MRLNSSIFSILSATGEDEKISFPWWNCLILFLLLKYMWSFALLLPSFIIIRDTFFVKIKICFHKKQLLLIYLLVIDTSKTEIKNILIYKFFLQYTFKLLLLKILSILDMHVRSCFLSDRRNYHLKLFFLNDMITEQFLLL